MGFLKKIFKKKKKIAGDSFLENKIQKNEFHEPSKSTLNPSSEGNREEEPGRIIISPRNARLQNQRSPSHDENFDHSNAVSPRLSQQHLQQFERQEAYSSAYGNQPPVVHQPIFQMSTDMPRQQMYAMDEMNRSDASSSSFNLSTDAEDSEYENFRSRGVLPGTTTSLSALDMSLSAASIPASYTTDQETIFPALDDLTIPSMTTATTKDLRSSALDPALYQQEEMARKLGLMPPPPPTPTPEDEPGHIPSPPKRLNEEWAISPSTATSNDPTSIKEVDSNQNSWAISVSSNEPDSTKSANPNPFFHFDEDPTISDQQMTTTTPVAFSPANNPALSATSGNTPNFTSPKSQASSSTEFSNAFDKDFADFGNFGGWGKEKIEFNKTNTSARGDFDRAFDTYHATSPSNHQITSSTSPNQQDRSLSVLLAKAKEKNRSNGSPSTPGRPKRGPGQVTSTSSVNSAPAITSSYLRQHYNLDNYNKHDNGGYDNRDGSRGLNNDETSVSDIIESLEVSNQMRRTGSGRNLMTSNLSIGDTGSSSISQLAKERLREREKRRKEYEYRHGRMHSSDSSDNSENEAAESWLFDGVTGALGPRGIAADLESLSGRSNRSKNSRGDKSHRSRHSRRKSKARKPRTSNESAGSRESRQSRYSHRSTRSYISQMSQESRSVAQDLLRLEMQLAMVGQENKDDLPAHNGGSVTGAGLVGSSRHRSNNRNKSYSSSQRPTSSSTSRRSKVTVIAPSGKLGIILANKADGKGTVVSGVRTSSVLVDQISPGDRIVAIDGEDVSLMTVSEITTIMSRKADYERTLTILTLPKYTANENASAISPKSSSGDYHPSSNHYQSSTSDNGYQHQHQYRR
jgi:hypothetical protein